MQSSGDPSLLRRLALAFGEGLVFSVGMKMMTEDAVRPRTAPVATGTGPDFAPLADRLGRIEKRLRESDAHRQAGAAPGAVKPAAAPAMGTTDQKVIVAIVGAVEKHLEAHAIKVQQRIDGLQAAVTASADAAAAKRIEKEVTALREQLLTMQREMLNSVAQVVATQVAAQVAQKTAALEASLQQSVDAAVAPLRTEVRDLRRHLSDTDDTMAEFVSAITDTVRRTSETLPAPARQDGEWRGSGRVDLKTLRRRLSDMDKRTAEPRLLPIPAAATQRRGPVPIREFPVAS
jgi:hypothetical protein